MTDAADHIEILDRVIDDAATGAARVPGGLRVVKPWGFVHLSPVTLIAGWYVCAVRGIAHAVSIQLHNQTTQDFLEVSVEEDRTVYLSLAAGEYGIRVYAGGRPGTYDYEAITLTRLKTWQKVSYFAARALRALLSEGPRSLWPRLQLIMSGRRGYGAQANTSVRASLAMGPLARRDYAAGGHMKATDVSDRLARLQDKPFFHVEIDDANGPLMASLEGQYYQYWTLEKGNGPVLYAHGADRLTADALLIFAEVMAAYPMAKVFFCDHWSGGRPSAKPGYDPYLHRTLADLGRVVMVRGVMQLSSVAAEQIIRIPVPLLHTEAGEVVLPCDESVAGCTEAVSVIIPTRDRSDLLSNCVRGLFDSPRGALDIIIVDNSSVESETFILFDEIRARGGRVVYDAGDFNFSRLCNTGARHATNAILAFVNNDIEIIHADGLGRMAALALKADVGAVGTELLYRDGTLQHGGVALGLSGCAGHPWRHAPPEAIAREASLSRLSVRTAVTAAFLVVEARKFWEVAGFDEIHYPVTLNDIDLCLKLDKAGYKTIYEPRARAYHLEGVSRGLDIAPKNRKRRAQEMQNFREKWGYSFDADSWLSPSYSRGHEQLNLR